MADIDKLLKIAAEISSGRTPKYQHNECFTSGAFDLLINNERGADAFDTLNELCRRFEVVDNSSVPPAGYYYLLSLLAGQSNTTAMPEGMSQIIKKYPDLSKELRVWYRLSS